MSIHLTFDLCSAFIAVYNLICFIYLIADLCWFLWERKWAKQRHNSGLFGYKWREYS
jgi:hypothetical protein